MKLEFDTDAGLGARATLGVIVLETDETLEHEFAQLLRLPGVALYHSRIAMQNEIRPDTLAQMARELPKSAALFPTPARFDVIGYGCTSGATIIGSDTVSRAIQKARPDAQVTDPLASIIAALAQLRAKRIGFVTPYIPEVSQGMRSKLEAAGLSIASFGSFMESDDGVVARISEAAILRAIVQVAEAAPCEAIAVSCTNLRCLGLIAQAERQIGIPVISSNQALAWHMLHLAGIAAGDEIGLAGFGALLAGPGRE